MLAYAIGYTVVAAAAFACCRLFLGKYTGVCDVLVDVLISVLWPVTVTLSLVVLGVSALCARRGSSDAIGGV